MNEPTAPGAGGRLLKAIGKFVLGAAIFAALIVWMGPDWGVVAERFEFHLGWALVSVAGTALATAFTAARWKLLNERMTPTRLGYGTYFHYIALTRFIGQFTSLLFMDLVGRGFGLRRAGSEQGLGRLVTPVLLERLLDLLLPAIVFVWALAVHETALAQHRWVSLLVLLSVFCVAMVPLIQPIAALALHVYVRLRRWRGAELPQEEGDVEVSRSTAAWVVVHSLGRFATVLLQFIGAGAAAGAVLGPDVVLSAFSIQQMTAVVAITPGGLGIQEAGWAGALGWLGQHKEVITLFMLATRVFVIANFGLLSLVTLPAGRKR